MCLKYVPGGITCSFKIIYFLKIEKGKIYNTSSKSGCHTYIYINSLSHYITNFQHFLMIKVDISCKVELLNNSEKSGHSVQGLNNE